MQVTDQKERPSLSPEQQAVKDELLSYCLSKEYPFPLVLLKGYAGTGKTFTSGWFIEELLTLDKDCQIALTAPTHKAVKVLRKFGPKEVGYATIHSLLGLTLEIDEKGQEIYKPAKDYEPRIESYDTVLLDETSMLNQELFFLLMDKKAERPSLRIIFMGDPIQIPPVGEELSISLMEGEKYNRVFAHSRHNDVTRKYKPENFQIKTLELKEIRRQALDNPILRFATAIRRQYDTGTVPAMTDIIQDPHGHDMGVAIVEGSDNETITTILKKYFDSPQFQEDADYMKVIGWTNKVVNSFNREIRKLIFKEDDPPLLKVGEKLVLDKPYVVPDQTRGKGMYKEGFKLATNEELKVISMVIKNQTLQYRAMEKDAFGLKASLTTLTTVIKVYEAIVEFETEQFTKRSVWIEIVHEDSIEEFNKIVAATKSAALVVPRGEESKKQWRHHYAVKKMFAQIKYNYAITGHKSQGSTYDNCMVVDWNLQQNSNLKERNHIRYTVTTRPRQMLFMIE